MNKNNNDQNILQEIKQKQIYPIYLLCGDETFLIEGTLTRMLDMLLEPSTRDFNLSFLDGTQATIKEAIADAEHQPMMADWAISCCKRSYVIQTTKDQS